MQLSQQILKLFLYPKGKSFQNFQRTFCEHQIIYIDETKPGPEVIKLFSCSTQLSENFFLLIIVKIPTIVGILKFMSRKIAV